MELKRFAALADLERQTQEQTQIREQREADIERMEQEELELI